MVSTRYCTHELHLGTSHLVHAKCSLPSTIIILEVGSTGSNAHCIGIRVGGHCLRFLATCCHCNSECVETHDALLMASTTFSAVLLNCHGFLMVGVVQIGGIVEPIVSWSKHTTPVWTLDKGEGVALLMSSLCREGLACAWGACLCEATFCHGVRYRISYC